MNTQTHAARSNIKKPKKDEAQSIIESLYETANEQDKPALAQLYQYFIPALPAKPKNDWQWLQKVVSKEQSRLYINYIYSDGENLVATDGNRLYIVPQEELEVGPYDVNGVKLDIDIGTFPDYKRIIPHYTDNEAITLDLKNAVVEKNKRAKGKFYYALSDNVGIDKAYLDHALSRDIGFTMYWDYSGHPALFKFDDGSQAVIMPVRV